MTHTNENAIDCAQHFPFWDRLSAEEQGFLCQNTTRTTYRAGQSIHNSDDRCNGVLLVTRGQLRCYILSEEGREVTLYRLDPGELCILSASCVLSYITFDVFIDAEQDTEVIQISTPAFQQVLQNNVYVELFAYQTAAERFSDIMWSMQQVLFMGVDQRLAAFLLNESSKTGTNQLTLTHKDIAKYMSTAREVVTRALKYLESEGYISCSRKQITIVDKGRLHGLL